MWMLALAAHPATPAPVLQRLLQEVSEPEPDSQNPFAFSRRIEVLTALAQNPSVPIDQLLAQRSATRAPSTDNAWSRALLHVLDRPGMTARTARTVLTAAAAGRTDLHECYLRVGFRAHTNAGVRSEILRAMTAATRGANGADPVWHRMLADPALKQGARLKILKKVVESPMISQEQMVAAAYTAVRFPRHAATAVRWFNAQQKSSPTTRTDLRAVIALPWSTTDPAQWTSMFWQWGLSVNLSRAELISATGDVDLVTRVLATDPTPSEARQILFHRHLPLPLRQRAATIVRESPSITYPDGTLAEVLIDSDPAWSEQFLAHAHEVVEADAARAVAGLSERTLERLAVLADDAPSNASRTVRIWAHVAAAENTGERVRQASLDSLRADPALRASLDVVKDLGQGPAHVRGGRVLAATETVVRWLGGPTTTGSGEVDAALAAFVARSAPQVSSPEQVEALFLLGGSFTGTMAELLDAAQAVGS